MTRPRSRWSESARITPKLISIKGSTSDATRCQDQTCGCSGVLHSDKLIPQNKAINKRQNRSRMGYSRSQTFPPARRTNPLQIEATRARGGEIDLRTEADCRSMLRSTPPTQVR